MLGTFAYARGAIEATAGEPQLYLTATPKGKLSVVIGACGESPPVAGVREYSETLAEL